MQLWGNVSCTMPVIITLAYLEQEHILLFLEVIPRMCRIYNISQWSLVQLRSYPLHVVQLMVKLRQPSVPFLWINGTWHENKKSATWNIDLYKGCPVLGSLSAYSLQVWHYQYEDCQKEIICSLARSTEDTNAPLWLYFLLWYFTTFYCLISVTKRKKKKSRHIPKTSVFYFLSTCYKWLTFFVVCLFFSMVSIPNSNSCYSLNISDLILMSPISFSKKSVRQNSFT